MKRKLDEKKDQTEADSDDSSSSSDSDDYLEQGNLLAMYNNFIDSLQTLTKKKTRSKKNAKKAKKKAKKAKITTTLGLVGAKQGTSKTVVKKHEQFDENKTLEGTSDESVQVVTMVKPKETLVNAFNVLPEDDMETNENKTITIDNTVNLDTNEVEDGKDDDLNLSL